MSFAYHRVPYHGPEGLKSRTARKSTSTLTLGRVDILSTIVLLGATLLIVAAFEEAGNKYPWKSPFVITLLTVSGNTVDLFLGMGKKSHACGQRHGAGVPVEVRPKSSLDWDVTVRDDHAT